MAIKRHKEQKKYSRKNASNQFHLINDVSDKEWSYAHRYFLSHPSSTFLKAQSSTGKAQHDFIKIKGKIYVISKGKSLGSGAFGVTRICQDKRGRNYALKEVGIEDIKKAAKVQKAKVMSQGGDKNDVEMIVGPMIEGAKRQSHQLKSEFKIAKEQGQAKGKVLIRAKNQTFKASKDCSEIEIKARLFTISALNLGGGLDDAVEKIKTDSTLTPKERLMAQLYLAQETAKIIQLCHEKGILHRDIKGENIMLVRAGLIESNNLVLIDYGLSERLGKDQTSLKLVDASGFPIQEGTPGYIAPESCKNGIYSRVSDVYAFGNMLKTEFDFSNDTVMQALMRAMIDPNPQNRPSMAEALEIMEMRQQFQNLKRMNSDIENRAATSDKRSNNIKKHFKCAAPYLAAASISGVPGVLALYGLKQAKSKMANTSENQCVPSTLSKNKKGHKLG